MGTTVSRKKSTPEETQTSSKRNDVIEQMISADQKVNANTIKMLLLGSSESGKSTIAKQMKIIHLDGFGEWDMIHFRHIILSNIVEAMRKLLKGVEKLGIEMDQNTKETSEIFYSKISNDDIEVDVVPIVQVLWQTVPIVACFAHKDQLYIGDHVEHFMTNLDRFGSENFTPAESDILFCRIATTGVCEIKFPYKNVIFRLIDVGGQKSERRKWVHCFDDVQAVLFVAALSSYDQVLEEDPNVNRMKDAIVLFNETYSNQYLNKSSTVLFLNKKDIFLSKLDKVPLRMYFPEYNGANTYSEASQFIIEQFIGQKNNAESVKRGRNVFCHLTNSIDTENVEVVFAAVADAIIKKNIMNTGLL